MAFGMLHHGLGNLRMNVYQRLILAALYVLIYNG